MTPALRAMIAKAVGQTKGFNGASGVFSFDANGDTTNRVFSIYKVVWHRQERPVGLRGPRAESLTRSRFRAGGGALPFPSSYLISVQGCLDKRPRPTLPVSPPPTDGR